MGSTIATGLQVNARAEAVGPRKSPETLKTPPPIRPGISPNYLTQAGVRCVDAMEAKRLCGMEEPSIRTLRQWTKDRRIPSIRMSGFIYNVPSEVEEHMREKHRVRATA